MAVVRKSPRLPDSMSVVSDPSVEDHAEWDGVEVCGDASSTSANAMQIAACRLRQLRLTGSQLERLRLRDCRLSGAVLSAAKLRHVKFSNCRMNGVNLRMTVGDVVEFSDCDLTGADLYQATLESARFHNCRLSQVEFSQARLAGAIFEGTDLVEVRGVASLRGITIDGQHAIGLAMALLPEMGIAISDVSDG